MAQKQRRQIIVMNLYLNNFFARSNHLIYVENNYASIFVGRGDRLQSVAAEKIVNSLLQTLDSKDDYTLKHCIRVARYAAIIAKKMCINPFAAEQVYLGGIFHDVGKVWIPNDILFKAGSLSEEEFAIIKTHPIQSEKLCSFIPLFQDIMPIVRHHHERVDGGGYPDRLIGDEIPLASRILAVADTIDAVTSNRPYRHFRTIDAVANILKDGAGRQWNADVVRVAIECFANDDFREVLMTTWGFEYATRPFHNELLDDTAFAYAC